MLALKHRHLSNVVFSLNKVMMTEYISKVTANEAAVFAGTGNVSRLGVPN